MVDDETTGVALEQRVFLYSLSSNLGILDVPAAVASFEDNKKGIDYVVLVLDEERYRRVQASINNDGYPLQLSDVGHVSGLCNFFRAAQLNGKLKSFEYASPDNYAAVLDVVLSAPSSDRKKTRAGYVVCDERLREDVLKYLSDKKIPTEIIQ